MFRMGVGVGEKKQQQKLYTAECGVCMYSHTNGIFLLPLLTLSLPHFFCSSLTYVSVAMKSLSQLHTCCIRVEEC